MQPITLLRLGALLLSITSLGCSPAARGESCKDRECAKGLVCDGKSECNTCADTPECKERGLCQHYLGKCIATTESCLRSKRCDTEHECTQYEGVCVSRHMIPKPSQPSDQKEGGCPCGCDRSGEMLSELRMDEPASSLETARESLRVIAEREHAGYVTEAMVSHRLSLRAFEREHGQPAVFGPSEAARALRAERASRPQDSLGDLRVRSELVVFGRTIEVVKGREKELAPCFQLWLEIENTATEPVSLARASMTGTTSFDVRRWYLEGTDGAPWDGALAAGETRAVILIGHVDEPLAPGAAVEARIDLGRGSITRATHALGSWDARL